MTLPGIEPLSPVLLANILHIRLIEFIEIIVIDIISPVSLPLLQSPL